MKVLSALEDPPPPAPAGDDEPTAQQLGEIAPAAGSPAVSNDDVAASQMAELGSENDPNADGGNDPGSQTPAPGTTNDGSGGPGELVAEISQTSQTAPVPPIGSLIASPNGGGALIETASNGTLVGVISQTLGDDAVPEITFSLTDNADGRFAIDPVTGEIVVLNGDLLDFETTTGHEITVLATSTDGTILAGRFLVSLFDDTTEFQVSAIADSDPSLDAVIENAPQGTPVGVMTVASDDDATDIVGFALLNDAEGRFTIDPVTGVISVADSGLLDFENGESHTITVEATSTDDTTSQASFTITLNDDNAEFTVGLVTDSDGTDNLISESGLNGATVGVASLATDDDGSDTITYRLGDDAGGRFAIDPVTGVVTVADGSLLDFEDATSQTIQVIASSSDGTEDEALFTISLSDDNTEFTVSAVSDSDGSASLISESTANMTPVGVTGFASDDDGSDSVTYSLSHNPDDLFAIDPDTGVVTVADGSMLDFETDASLTIEITATSTDGTEEAEYFFVTLSDDTSEFQVGLVSDSNMSTNIVDDSTVNGIAITVTGSASDDDGTDTVSYDLTNDAGGRFSVDATSGVVSIADSASIQFTVADGYDITIRGTSTDGSTNSGAFTIRVLTSSFKGRAKRTFDTAVGTDDFNTADNIALTSINVGNDRFVSIPSSTFVLDFPATTGTFAIPAFTSFSTTVSGTGFFAADRDFVFYELTESANQSNRHMIFAGIPTANAEFPTTGFFSYDMRPDFTLGGTAIPFVRASSGGNVTDRIVSELYISWDTAASGGTNPHPVFAQASFALGSNQEGGLVVAMGRILPDGTNPYFLTGGVSGSFNPNNASAVGANLVKGSIATADGGNGFDFFGNGSPKYAVIEAVDASQFDTVQDRGLRERTNGSQVERSEIPYYPNIIMTGGPNNTISTTRTSRTLNGFVSGGLQTDGTSQFYNAYSTNAAAATATGIVITTSAEEGQLSATISVADTGADFVRNFSLGGIDGSTNSAFINDDLFVARESNANSTDTLALASSGMVPLLAAHIPAGVSLCACTFMKWGHWAGDYEMVGESTERYHLAHWVAGELAAGIDVPAGGSATFTGHAIGTISETTIRQFVANMSATFDFSNRLGTVTLSNLESKTFIFDINSAAMTANTFTGALDTELSTPGYSGDTRGAFFNNGANLAHGIAGDFVIEENSTPFSKMSGVYVGEQP